MMSQIYVSEKCEKKGIKFHIPFTPYFLYRGDDNLLRIVEKELRPFDVFNFSDKIYWYRFL